VQFRRGFMMALGCIQAQVPHRHLPHRRHHAGPLRQRALVVADKAPRVAQYHANTLHALELLQAAGLMHPDQLTPTTSCAASTPAQVRLLSAMMPTCARRHPDDLEHQHNVYRLYWPLADARSFAPHPPTAARPGRQPGPPAHHAGRPARRRCRSPRS
jgi:hypothetical protein